MLAVARCHRDRRHSLGHRGDRNRIFDNLGLHHAGRARMDRKGQPVTVRIFECPGNIDLGQASDPHGPVGYRNLDRGRMIVRPPE